MKKAINFPTYENEPISPTDTHEAAVPALVRHTYGLTKLEYFAGLAMQGILTSKTNVGIADIDPGAITGLAVRCAWILCDRLNEHNSKEAA